MNTLSTTIVQRTVVSCANMAVIDEVESAVEVGLIRAGSEARLRQGEDLDVK
jgi:hypothetical protein